jgi:chaperonin GroEL
LVWTFFFFYYFFSIIAENAETKGVFFFFEFFDMIKKKFMKTQERLSFAFSKDIARSLSVLDAIDESIKISLGPTGKNGLLLTKNFEVKCLTNGSTILTSLEWPAFSENLFCRLLEQSAKKSEKFSGDGSTTTVLVACQLLKTCTRFLTSGYDSIFLSSGLKKIASFCSEKCASSSWPIQTFEQAKGLLKTLGGKKLSSSLQKLLASSVSHLRRDGIVIVEENQKAETEVEIVQGIEVDRGFASAYFVTDLKKFEIEYENPYLLLASHPILVPNQLREVLDHVKKTNRPLIILTEEIAPEILSSLVLSTIQKKAKLVVIKYNSVKFVKTGVLEDLAVLSHSNYFLPESKKPSSRNFLPTDLGQVEKARIQKEKSTFILSKFSKLLATRRINELNRELLTSETDYEKSLLETRIARLSGNITKLKLSAATEYQLQEEKQKLEKILATIRSSLEEGLLPGGGVFYLSLKDEIKQWSSLNLVGDEMVCGQIASEALGRPFADLCSNTNTRRYSLLSTLEELGYPYAYNFLTKEFLHSFEEGLVDSAKSVRAGLWNALSITASIITSE